MATHPHRLMILTALLPACAGLFDGGRIDQTCEDLPGGCGGQADADADVDADSDADADADADVDDVVVTGLGWSWTSEDLAGWGARAWDPGPQALLDQGCSGTLGGPVSWGGAEAWIIDADGIARVGPSSLRWYEPDLEVGYDVRVMAETVWIADGAQVVGLSPSSGAEVERLDVPDLDVRRLLVADGVLVLMDQASTKGQAAFWTWTPGTDTVEQLPDVLPSPDYAAGGIFSVDQDLHVCTATGRIHAVADLAAGDTEPLVAASGATGVLSCAWDPLIERYLLVDAEAGLLALDSTAQTTLVDAGGSTLLGASFHDGSGAGR